LKGPGRLRRLWWSWPGRFAYLAGWDVHHANLFDRVEAKTGIEPFGRLVEQVMTVEPYASARTVYWIDWTFTRTDLDRLLTRIDAHEPELRLPA
jgi:hypothetical protein